MFKDELFIGPLPEESYKEVTAEFQLFRQDRVVELTARALYGQKKSRDHTVELEELLANSAIDNLTGLYRRDETYSQIQKVICGLELNRRGADPQEGLMVTFFDVEDFKNINDKGWDQGNEALRTVAHAVWGLGRSSLGDFPGRIGGDEFVHVTRFDLLEASTQDILKLFESRIKIDMPIKTPELPSLRWHHAFYRHGDSAESLISRADPKGVNKDLARSHRQNEFQYQQALLRASHAQT